MAMLFMAASSAAASVSCAACSCFDRSGSGLVPEARSGYHLHGDIPSNPLLLDRPLSKVPSPSRNFVVGEETHTCCRPVERTPCKADPKSLLRGWGFKAQESCPPFFRAGQFEDRLADVSTTVVTCPDSSLELGEALHHRGRLGGDKPYQKGEEDIGHHGKSPPALAPPHLSACQGER